MSKVKSWVIIQKFDATEEMARNIRATQYAMGINTNRDGFKFKRIQLKEAEKDEIEAIKDIVSTDLSNHDKLNAIEDILGGKI